MDIWEWVLRSAEEAREAGRARLADLMELVPHLAVNDDHARLDAVVPEALALAREAKQPWLEVYFRHWNLQSRILRRAEVSQWLPEAVSLLEFAHREETRGCPQSVCATQDLVSCYGQLDGPGYVEERLAASAEALGRIDATWPCFVCISAEYANALVDGGRAEEALAYCERQQAARLAVGEAPRALASTRVEALLALGRHAEALETLSWLEEPPDEHERLERSIRKAWALAGLGRHEEARQELPAYEEIRSTADLYLPWVRTTSLLALGGALANDWRLERQWLALEDGLTRNGAVRYALEVACERARLALARQRPGTVRHALRRMEALVPRLRRPLGATAQVQEVRRGLESLTPTPPSLPDTPEALLKALPEDLEEGLETLAAARARWPGLEDRWVETASSALAMLGREEEAREVLREQLRQAPDAGDILWALAVLLRQHGRAEELRRLGQDSLRQATTPAAHARARVALAWADTMEGRLEEALGHLRHSLELEEAFGPMLELARLERKVGALEAALARLDAAVERWPRPDMHDCERMVVGTLLERWDNVRHSAARLGLSLPGEGPISLNGGLCRVSLQEPDGTRSLLLALRTGPASARVISLGGPDAPQHLGDALVIWPLPLEKAGDADQTPRELPPLYEAVTVKQPGHHFIFGLDGVHPGEEALEALRRALGELDVTCVVGSDELYRVESPEGEELPGLYMRVGVPPMVSLDEVAATLRTAAMAWPHPVGWPALLERLGRGDEAAAHRELLERYGITP